MMAAVREFLKVVDRVVNDLTAKLGCQNDPCFSGLTWTICHWQDAPKPGYRIQITRRTDGESLHKVC